MLRVSISLICLLASCSDDPILAASELPVGFQFTDSSGNEIVESDNGKAQVRDQDGRVFVEIVPSAAIDFSDSSFARNDTTTVAHIVNRTGLEDKITLFVPCKENANSVVVCPGATSLEELEETRGIECPNRIILNQLGRTLRGYTFDNLSTRSGDEDCQVSAPVDVFGTGGTGAETRPTCSAFGCETIINP